MYRVLARGSGVGLSGLGRVWWFGVLVFLPILASNPFGRVLGLGPTGLITAAWCKARGVGWALGQEPSKP